MAIHSFGLPFYDLSQQGVNSIIRPCFVRLYILRFRLIENKSEVPESSLN